MQHTAAKKCSTWKSVPPTLLATRFVRQCVSASRARKRTDAFTGLYTDCTKQNTHTHTQTRQNKKHQSTRRWQSHGKSQQNVCPRSYQEYVPPQAFDSTPSCQRFFVCRFWFRRTAAPGRWFIDALFLVDRVHLSGGVVPPCTIMATVSSS